MKRFLLVFLAIVAPTLHASTNVFGTISKRTTWSVNGSPYIVTGTVTVASAGSLSIAAGATVKFNSGTGLIVQGPLTAVGTATSPVVFTTSSTSTARGQWTGIQFSQSVAGCKLQFAQISYATTAVSLTASSPTIDHVTVTESSGDGIYVADGTSTTAFSFINANGVTGWVLDTNSASVSIVNSRFTNSGGGVLNTTSTSTPVKATLNYWGSADGPSGSGTGTGTAAGNNVTFDPYLTTDPTLTNKPEYFVSFSRTNTRINPSVTGACTTSWTFTTSLTGSWVMNIYPPAGGAAVKTFSGSGTTATVSWDGKVNNVAQAAGTYTYSVSSTTTSSQVAGPAVGQLILSSGPMLQVRSGTQPLFSSTAGIYATLNWGTSWLVKVHSGTATGSVVRTSATFTSSDITFLWDGMNDAATVTQPDGTYVFEAIGTSCSYSESIFTTTVMDKTPPTLSISFPSVNQVIANASNGQSLVNITGTATDAHFSRWDLSIASRTEVISGTPVVNSTFFAWDTLASLNGSTNIHIEASDTLGNTARLDVPVTVSNFKVSTNNQFDLDASAAQTLPYTTTVPGQSTQTSMIKNAAGQVVRTLFSGSRAAGTYTDVWNGKGDNGLDLPDGTYFYLSTVSSATGNITWDQSQTPRSTSKNPLGPTITGSYDPFKSSPLTYAYTLPTASHVVVEVASWSGDRWAYDCAGLPAGSYCIQSGFQSAGTHTFSWPGTLPNGQYIPNLQRMMVVYREDNFPKGMVVLTGNSPALGAVSVSPPLYNPNLGPLTLTVPLSTRPGRNADITATFVNQATLTATRTIVLANQAAGSISFTWDGKSDTNSLWAVDGPYTVILKATDRLTGSTSTISTVHALTTVMH